MKCAARWILIAAVGAGCGRSLPYHARPLSPAVTPDAGKPPIPDAGSPYDGGDGVVALTAQEAYLKASNTRTLAAFGTTLALYADTLAVGSYGESSGTTGINGNQQDTGAPGAGAVYLFVRTDGVWSQQAYLKPSNTTQGEQFGMSVALWGDTLAVGTWNESSKATGIDGDQKDLSARDSGAVFIFTRTAGVWTQQAYLKASNTRAGAYFGFSLALEGDTLAVGSNSETSDSTGVNGSQVPSHPDAPDLGAGAVYLFTRTAGVWSQQAYLKASNTVTGGTSGGFGQSVALWGDTLAVGASSESSAAKGVDGNQDDTSAFNAGAVYVFVRGPGGWAQQAYLKASNTRANALFGRSVALTADTLVAGAPGESSSASGINGDQSDSSTVSGAAYVFTRTAGAWSQQAYVKATNTRADAPHGALFGYDVALEEDTLVVGAPWESSGGSGINGDQHNPISGAVGAVYTYARIGPRWFPLEYLKASNPRPGAFFGASVGISGDTVAAGSFGESSDSKGINGDQSNRGASGSGAVYVFH